MARSSIDDDLSPEPIAPEPVHPPWGLSWDDLGRCVPIGRELVAIHRTHRVRGVHRVGGAQILNLHHTASDGPKDLTVFLKLCEPQRPESLKYSYLQALGAPVPRLLFATGTDVGEVIGLEFLPTVGVLPSQSGEVLDLVALINATAAPTSVFAASSGDPDHPERVRDALSGHLDRWESTDFFATYLEESDRFEEVPLALNHNELGFQQVGRTAAGQLVMFDLETMSLAGQFTDIASVLHTLAGQTGRSEHILFREYLSRLELHGEMSLEPMAAWNQMLRTRIVRTFDSLPWLVDMAGDTRIEPVQSAMERLRRDLAALSRPDR